MTYASGARDEAYGGRSLVAAFADRETAHDAARRLKDEGFHDIWLGVTHPASDQGANVDASAAPAGMAETTVSSDEGGDGFFGAIGRFFSGDSGDRSLYDELVRHGVAESEARRIDGSIQPHSAILTVDGSNHPELAAQIIEQCEGHLLAGEAFATSDTAEAGAVTGAAVADRSSRRGSEVLGYRDPDRYARGEEIDQQRRLQLREERLSVDKRRVPAGEATIGKDVVETRQDIEVPVVREELFIERRAVAEGETRADAAPIGEGETIRVPLMREEVMVTKRPVVTGEVLVGKRAVTETRRVSDTTRSERLRVDDPTGAATGGSDERSPVSGTTYGDRSSRSDADTTLGDTGRSGGLR